MEIPLYCLFCFPLLAVFTQRFVLVSGCGCRPLNLAEGEKGPPSTCLAELLALPYLKPGAGSIFKQEASPGYLFCFRVTFPSLGKSFLTCHLILLACPFKPVLPVS